MFQHVKASPTWVLIIFFSDVQSLWWIHMIKSILFDGWSALALLLTQSFFLTDRHMRWYCYNWSECCWWKRLGELLLSCYFHRWNEEDGSFHNMHSLSLIHFRFSYLTNVNPYPSQYNEMCSHCLFPKNANSSLESDYSICGSSEQDIGVGSIEREDSDSGCNPSTLFPCQLYPWLLRWFVYQQYDNQSLPPVSVKQLWNREEAISSIDSIDRGHIKLFDMLGIMS